MRARTQEEIKAYVEGYNSCFERFCEILDKGRNYNREAINRMKIFVTAVNSVVEVEEEGKVRR